MPLKWMTDICLDFHQVTPLMTSIQSWTGRHGQVAPTVFKEPLRCAITEPVENYRRCYVPLFRVTGEEKDSTRGRANSLRLAMSGQLGPNAMASAEMLETMKLRFLQSL